MTAKSAVRAKRDASMLVAARLVAAGDADALVTAGNTGAAVLACAQHFTLIPGVRKAALASVYPRQTEYPEQDALALLLDVGATVRCDADELVQFALMGSAYARRVSKVASPRVALLNMGREPSKGGEVLADAYRRLRTVPGLNFVGNIEGNDLAKGQGGRHRLRGAARQRRAQAARGPRRLVVDLAGTAAREHWRWKLGFMMLATSVGRLRDLTDYAAYGGAPVLGFEHLLIKAHGRSRPAPIANAVKVAAKAVRDGVTGEIAAAIGQL